MLRDRLTQPGRLVKPTRAPPGWMQGNWHQRGMPPRPLQLRCEAARHGCGEQGPGAAVGVQFEAPNQRTPGTAVGKRGDMPGEPGEITMVGLAERARGNDSLPTTRALRFSAPNQGLPARQAEVPLRLLATQAKRWQNEIDQGPRGDLYGAPQTRPGGLSS